METAPASTASRRKLAIAAGAVLAVLGVASCTSAKDGATADASKASTTTTPSIAWEPCGDLECGTVTVPVDPADPSLGTLNIAVNVHRATNPAERIGYLLVNPGGPGGSGLDLAATAAVSFGETVASRFDVVGFDPRGVGRSEPSFKCGDGPRQRELLLPLSLPLDETEVAIAERAARLCADSMGPVASRLGTAFVAHDMEAIRRALGVETISYFGYSYGSAVGVWYASLYPQHVRAMVVDGADDVVHDVSTQQVRIADAIGQAKGFEDRLVDALAACATPECPIYNGGNPTGAYYDAVRNMDRVTAVTGAPDTALLGIVSFLYSEEGWPLLWKALADLAAGDPSAIVESAKLQQQTDGASFSAMVNCLDSWAINPAFGRAEQLGDVEATELAIAEHAPLLAAASSPVVEACPFLDVLEPPRAESALRGGDVPIVVIGNRSDPATSFADSERLATNVLSNGYLVATDHHKHGVFPENDCVNAHVHTLLFDGRPPAEKVVSCPRQDPEEKAPRVLLDEVCTALVQGLTPPPTEAQRSAICEQFVVELTAGKTDAELAALVSSTDPTTIQHIRAVLNAAIMQVMG